MAGTGPQSDVEGTRCNYQATYNEQEIKRAKKTLFDLCGRDTLRNISRQRDRVSEKNIEDMIKLLQSMGTDIPVFVGRDLSRLPQITFDSLDVSVLLAKINKTQTELDMMKQCSNAQLQLTDDPKNVVSDMNEKVNYLESTMNERSRSNENVRKSDNTLLKSHDTSVEEGAFAPNSDSTKVKSYAATVQTGLNPYLLTDDKIDWSTITRVNGRLKHFQMFLPPDLLQRSHQRH